MPNVFNRITHRISQLQTIFTIMFQQVKRHALRGTSTDTGQAL
jgi:hypothetical protein